MPAAGVINRFRLLRGDVSFERTDGSPVADLDSPIYYTSASRIFMGPVSGGGGGGGSFSLGVSTGGNTAGQTGVTGTRVVLAGAGAVSLSQSRDGNGASITVSAPVQSAQTQNRFNLTLDGNTAGALAEVSSGTLTLAGGPNITISQNGNAITISGVGSGTGAQTDQTLGLYANGNTTGESSSTTRDARSVSLRGDGAVSVGFSNGSIRISAPLQSVQPETQTFIAGVAASDTTYSSGTVKLLALGNVTVRSTTGQQIQISVPAQSVQPETQTFLGGISASDTLYTSGTVRFTGVGGGVTVSTNTGQRIDISVAAPVAQTGTQFSAGISGGNTAGQTGTVGGRLVLAGGTNITLSGSTNGASETVTILAGDVAFSAGVSNIGNSSGQTGATGTRLVLAGGQSVTLSQATDANGGTITISGASTSQSAQTQDRFNLTLSGNTAGVMAQVSSGTLTLAGGNNITVSQNGNAITISGANVGGAQTGISGIANSQTTFTSGTVSLSELGAITIRSTTGNQFQLSVNPQTGTQFTGGISGGNTSGDTGTVAGRVLLAGGNNITLSGSTNGASQTITISGPNTLPSFSGGISGGNTSGDTGATGTRLVFAGGNNVTLSGSTNANGGTITISGANIGGAQTGISGIIASDATYTSGTVRFTGVGGGITVSSNTGQRVDLSVAAPINFSAGASNLGNTAGDTGVTGTRLVLVGGQSISLSQATNANGGTITIDGATTSQSNQSEGWYALGNTVGESSSTTRDARSISVRGDGIVSVGYSAGSLRISASQSVQPETQTFIGGIANTETTYTSGTVKLLELGAITVRSTTGNQFQLSVAAQTAESQSFGMSNIGNTSGTTGIASGAQVRFLLAGGNNVTLSQSLNGASGTITISAASQSAESQSIGMSNIGNTSGTTGVASGAQVRFVLAGGNNITLSQSLNGASGTITISAFTQTNQTEGWYALGNTTGQSSSTTFDARTVSIRGDGIVSVGYSGGSLRISATEVPQTNQTLGMYAVQNTTGQSSSTTMDARTLSVAGDGIVSVGYSAGSLRISASQSVQPETQTFIGGIANTETTYTSGTVKLLELGAITVRSTTGNQFQLSVNAQTGTQFSAGISGGNTAGDTGTVAGRVVLAGGANVTLSGSTNGASETITIVGPSPIGFVAGVSGGNTSGDTGATGTRVVFAGGNNITLSQNTGAAGASITISGPNAQTGISGIIGSDATYTSGTVQFTGSNMVTVKSSAGQRIVIDATQTVQTQGQMSLGVSTGGNTAGDTGVTGTRLVLVGSNNITLSQATAAAGGTITISGPTTVAQTDQTLGMYAVGNTTGQSSSTTRDARSVSIDGAGIISVGYSGGSLRISATQSVQPETQTFIGGIANTETTYTSGTVKLLELGAITVRSTTGNQYQLSVNAQTEQTQSRFNLTISGNTAGAGALVSSGVLTLAGGNNITLSQAGNAITISGGAGGAFSGGVSNVGNTSGDTGITGSRLVLSGGQSITLSQSTNASGATVMISGASTSQSVQSLGMYAVQNTTGQSSSTTMDARTLSIAGDGAVSVGYSGGSLRISAPVQTVGSQSIGMSNVGNTSGTTGIASGGQVRFIFAGGNNVTLSQSLNGASGTITISAPNAQTGISGIANSQTTYTSGTVSMSELGAITIRSTTGNQYQFSVNPQTGTQFSAGISGGNTAGDTGTVAGRVVLAGGANITLSGSTNGASETISIVGGAGGAFSAGVSTGGNTAGATGVSGTQMVLVGSGVMSLSQTTGANGNTVSILAPASSVLSAVAPLSTSTAGSTISILGPAQLSVGFSTPGNTSGDTGFVTGRLALVGSNGITLSGSTNAGSQTITISGITQSAESQSIGMSNIGNTSGTTGIASGAQVRMLFAGGNNITLSQSLNGASGTITISAPNAQTGISGIAASNTTYTSGTITITGVGGGVTVSSNTGQRIDISVAAQTVESQSIGASNLGNTLGTSGVASGGQVRAVILGTSNITVSQSVNGASATLSLIGQPSFSGGVSNLGNSAGATGVSGTRLVLVGSNNITLSQTTDASGATVSINAPSPGAAQYSVGVSNLGNTAGSTGVTGTRIVFAGTGNISLSQSTDATGATISINNTVSAFQAGVSTMGNTAGATGVSGTQMVLVGSGAMSLSQTTGAAGNTVSILGPAASVISAVSPLSTSTNGSTISILGPATSSLSAVSGIKLSTNGSTISIGYGAPLADWENMPRQQGSLISHASGFSKTPIYWNDHIDGDLTAKSLAFAISMVTASQPLSLSAHLGIYTLVNSTSAALLGSVSEAYVVSSASSVSLSGVRNLIVTGIGTHTALSVITGGEYVIGMMFSATATNAMNFSLVGATGGAGPFGGIYPGTNQLTTGTSQGIQPLAGRGSTTVNAMPANVSQADLVNQGTGASQPLHPWIYIRS